MSRQKYERHRKIPPLTRNPEGKPICRHWDCENIVKPPRRSWCSAACVKDAMIQSSASHARQAVEERDKGVCARCGLDTATLVRDFRRTVEMSVSGFCSYRRLTAKVERRYGAPEIRGVMLDSRYNYARIAPEHIARVQKMHARLKRMAFFRAKRIARHYRALGFHEFPNPDSEYWTAGIARRMTASPWQADHIVPVCEGGGSCKLDNLQTLCTACHKTETRELAKRRSKAARAVASDRKQQPQLFRDK